MVVPLVVVPCVPALSLPVIGGVWPVDAFVPPVAPAGAPELSPAAHAPAKGAAANAVAKKKARDFVSIEDHSLYHFAARRPRGDKAGTLGCRIGFSVLASRLTQIQPGAS